MDCGHQADFFTLSSSMASLVYLFVTRLLDLIVLRFESHNFTEDVYVQRFVTPPYFVLSYLTISVFKVYYKYRKQTLLQKHLDNHSCLERRHEFTKGPSRSKKHCVSLCPSIIGKWGLYSHLEPHQPGR